MRVPRRANPRAPPRSCDTKCHKQGASGEKGGKNGKKGIRIRLTSVIIDEVEIGRRAVELLEQMRSGDRPLEDNEEIVVPLSLSDGRTLGPAPIHCSSQRSSQPVVF